MKKRKTSKTTAGTGKDAVRHREDKFIAAYLANNQNATRAALAAGSTKASAEWAGWDFLRRPRVKAEIAKKKKELLAKYDLTQERVLREVARIAYFDVAGCYDDKGALKPIHEMDEDTRRAIAVVKEGEYKAFDKNTALRGAMQYLGLLPRAGLSMKAQMSVAASEVSTTIQPEKHSMLEVARRVAFVLTMGAELAETQAQPPSQSQESQAA